MVRGGSSCEWSNEKWSVVEVAELDIRGKDIDWLRSTPYYGNTHTHKCYTLMQGYLVAYPIEIYASDNPKMSRFVHLFMNKKQLLIFFRVFFQVCTVLGQPCEVYYIKFVLAWWLQALCCFSNGLC